MTVEIHRLTVSNLKLVGHSRRALSREAENVESVIGSPQRSKDDAGGRTVAVRRCRYDQTEKETEERNALHLSRA